MSNYFVATSCGDIYGRFA